MFDNLQYSLGFVVTLSILLVTVSFLVLLYKPDHSDKLGRLRHWLGRWEFTADQIESRLSVQLALASFLSLFLEMLMIHWISAEIPVFAYFKNIVLIGCFLGFGTGCYLARARANLLALIVPLAVLATLIKLPWRPLRLALQGIPFYIAQTNDIYLWGTSGAATGLIDALVAVVMIVGLFALIAFTFIPLGQIVGSSLEAARNGIAAYSVNVLFSLFGILAYTGLCFLELPPPIWFAMSALLALALFWRVKSLRWRCALGLAVCTALVSIGPQSPARVLWSPYQKITISPVPNSATPMAYDLLTNDNWHQRIINLSPAFVSAHPELFKKVPAEWNSYNVPYHFYRDAGSVLILGAGTGNDVAAALRNSTGQVVAVEIDPSILKLGRQLHFEKPYDSPRVRTVVNDARSYIQNSTEKFDLIVFSLLDSHTEGSYFSNIRIDNYVYTLEAMRAARRLLTRDGVFIVKFWAATPWIGTRLHNLVRLAFDQDPVDMNVVAYEYTSSGRFIVAGSPARLREAMDHAQGTPYVTLNRVSSSLSEKLTTDDWPYLYQRQARIPPSFIVLSIAIALFGGFMLRATGVEIRSLDWHFFFLGAGFMLLEAQIVSKMALLFGTTWVVNSIVVSVLLILIVAANTVVQRFRRISLLPVYVLLFCSLLTGYLVPLNRLFFASIWLKALSAMALLCLPVFFAGIIFVRSFADAGFHASALGSNLFGALTGGLLECISFWTGIQSLLLVAAALYALSRLTLRADAQHSTARLAASHGR